jgi:hypothetical protein
LSITKADCEQEKKKKKKKKKKKPKQKPNETGVGKKLSPAPARANCKHAPSSGTSLYSRQPPKPLISSDLCHREARVMKDLAEKHRSGSKEDIKNAQPEKTHQRHTRKAAPQHRRPV